ncbi:MAG TPA: hypothetical protein PLO99_02805 [Chitinophagaceae bacterium]|jgi:hypothetical protein|nr:hypothetical protein [Chitinophagaceae bacterium]HRG91455.1 hypothetical protein [Chitinophagaceae bacterium]
MKYIILVLWVSALSSCKQQTDNKQLQNRIDSLEIQLANSYKPGFGELMSSIQTHHAKLWFAGQNENWRLAGFEVHEIMEVVEDIQKFQTERKESQQIKMIHPSLDSISMAIEQKNPALFRSSYSLLTTACNNCHRATDFDFNVVKIPDTQSFSNQDFKINK